MAVERDGYYEGYWREGLGDWTPRGGVIDAAERRLLAPVLTSGSHVLEIGCGDGRAGCFIRDAGARYIGVDVSEAAAGLCRDKGLQVCVQDLSRPLPFRDEAFDAVAIFEVLEHLFRPDLVIGEIARVLRPGGWLIGSVPNVAFLPNRVLLGMGFFNSGGSPTTALRAPWRDPHVRFFTVATLRGMLGEFGRFDRVTVCGQAIRASQLPVVYRWGRGGSSPVDTLLRPVAGMGRLWPSLFSSRLFFSARSRKPGAAG